MQLESRFRFSRFVALFTGAVIASATLFPAAPARADKAKNLKYGAIGLGVLGAYYLSKGKTVPAAAAAAGGYYVYKKSQNAKYDARYGANRYGYNPYGNSSGAIYPDSSYDSGYDTQTRSSAVVRNKRRQNRNNRAGNFDLSPYRR